MELTNLIKSVLLDENVNFELHIYDICPIFLRVVHSSIFYN